MRKGRDGDGGGRVDEEVSDNRESGGGNGWHGGGIQGRETICNIKEVEKWVMVNMEAVGKILECLKWWRGSYRTYNL